jgi:hypothetical protein
MGESKIHTFSYEQVQPRSAIRQLRDEGEFAATAWAFPYELAWLRERVIAVNWMKGRVISTTYMIRIWFTDSGNEDIQPRFTFSSPIGRPWAVVTSFLHISARTEDVLRQRNWSRLTASSRRFTYSTPLDIPKTRARDQMMPCKFMSRTLHIFISYQNQRNRAIDHMKVLNRLDRRLELFIFRWQQTHLRVWSNEP